MKSVLWPVLNSNVVDVSLSGGSLGYWTACNNFKRQCTLPYCVTDANEINMYQIYFVCYHFIQLSTQLFISLFSQIASNGYISVWLILQWLLLVLNIPRNIRSFRIKHIPCIMPVNMFGISPGVIVMIVSCYICQCVFIVGTLGCVFIDNETHESGVTKCTTGEAWSAFSWQHSSVFHCQWTHNQVFLLLSYMLI